MKQEAAAEELGVSQAYVSRLEAGSLQPSREIAERMATLMRSPEHRAYFDHWRAAIRHCPGKASLIRQHDDHVCLVEVSKGFRALGSPFADAVPGEKLRALFGPQIVRPLEFLVRTGITEGKVSRVEAVWQIAFGGRDICFEAVSTPVRDDFGHWHVYTCHMPIACEVYRTRLREQRAIVVQPHD